MPKLYTNPKMKIYWTLSPLGTGQCYVDLVPSLFRYLNHVISIYGVGEKLVLVKVVEKSKLLL